MIFTLHTCFWTACEKNLHILENLDYSDYKWAQIEEESAVVNLVQPNPGHDPGKCPKIGSEGPLPVKLFFFPEKSAERTNRKQ